MNKTKQWLWNIISSGLPSDVGIEVLRKVVLINTTMLFGGTCLFLLTVNATIERVLLLAAADAVFLAFIIAMFAYLRKTGNHEAIALIGTVVCGFFFAFLIAYGGIQKTAYIWSFTYPLIALFLIGEKRGSWMSLLLLTAACAVFLLGSQIPWLTGYNREVIIRFIPAYIIIFLFAFAMEKVRDTVQLRLETSNRELQGALDDVQQRTAALSKSNRELQTEISERLRAEKALRESESFFENVIESIQDGISVLNPDLTIRHTNGVMRQWYAENAPLVGKKCHECYHNKHQPCDPCPTIRSLQSGETEREIVPGLQGSPVEWIELYSFPIKEKETGKITGIVEFVRDITSQRRLEKQLAQAERMDSIGRLAGGIAHDFNNLLMGIQGSASLMTDHFDSEHECAQHLKKIETCVNNAAELTARLLGFARGGKYEVRVTDLNELIRENLDLFERTKKELRISNDFAANLWPTEIDRGQINQVFLNLFVNAWEAMPAEGDLRLKTENVRLGEDFVRPHGVAAGNYVRVTVTDTGSGMDEATRAHIFDPFFTTKEKGSGTGLGLASAYGIVKNHSGIITAESQPDRGATFSVYLPASDKQVVQSEAPAGEVARGSETVLLVDDSRSVRQLLKFMLSLHTTFDISEAGDGLEAVNILIAKDFDLVITDIRMPQMDGLSLIRQVRDEISTDVPIIVVSTRGREADRDAGLELGANSYITKPVQAPELIREVTSLLN